MKQLYQSQYLWQQIKKVPLATIRQILNLVLVVLLAWLLAKLSWLVLPEPEAQPLAIAVQPGQVAAKQGVDLNALLHFSLFGKAEPQSEKKAETPVVTEAPKTQLNVKLTGLVAVGDDPSMGGAIIESRGSEATYAIDDTIEGTNAVLKQVLADRVLLLQAGQYETLMLDGMEYTKMAQANAGLGRADDTSMEYEQQVDMAPSPEPEGLQPVTPDLALEEHREQLIAEPMKFFDYIRVSPHRPNGELVGYRLTPGKDPTLFQDLGLQANDLAIEINGIRLNDMQQAMAAINELRDAREAAIKIERDGEIRDILINLSQ